jgi:cytochrome b6-f complex iron-sulfur subunit
MRERDGATGESIDEPAAPDRREFLERAGRLVIAACSAGGGAMAAGLAMPPTGAGPSARVAIGTPADFKIGTLTWLRDLDLFIARSAEGFAAISARCTHLGCTVHRTDEGFACPCHGAAFDATGSPKRGPARRALPWYEVHLAADGRLWVWTDREVETGSTALVEDAG